VPLQYSAPDAFAAINATLYDASATVAACLNANTVSCAEGPGYNWTQFTAYHAKVDAAFRAPPMEYVRTAADVFLGAAFEQSSQARVQMNQ
jgi:hypothetical protein